MADLTEIIDSTGQPRMLMPVEHQKMTAALPVYGDGDPSLMIPRDQWQNQPAMDGLARFIPPAKNQGSIGMCNCSATGMVLEYTRNKMGLTQVNLAAGDLYRRISGGVDQGSMLQDAIKVTSEQGMCSEAVSPYLEWRRKAAGAEAEYPEFRVLEWEWAPTTEHLFSAAFKSFGINIGILWGSRDDVDADGWLPDGAGGSVGGHSIMRAVPVYSQRRGWGLAGPNSWSGQWGANIFGKPGWMTISERRLKSQENQNFGWFIARQVVYSRPGEQIPQ